MGATNGNVKEAATGGAAWRGAGTAGVGECSGGLTTAGTTAGEVADCGGGVTVGTVAMGGCDGGGPLGAPPDRCRTIWAWCCTLLPGIGLSVVMTGGPGAVPSRGIRWRMP